MDQSIEPLLDDAQVAAVLGVSPETLAAWRSTKRVTLPYIKVGGRLVRYRRSDVIALIEAGLQPQPATDEA